jgi:hypothetical protein
MGENNSQNKKNGVLGILSLIFSAVGIFVFIGIILGIIDLAINDKSKKHSCSIIGLCIGFFWVAIILLSSSSAEQEQISSDQVIVVESEENKEVAPTEDEQECYAKGQFFETDDLKITIDSAILDYTDYEDEYGFYAPEEGMKYVYVAFTYENIGDSDAYASIYDYTCYADGMLMEQTYYFNGDFINANLSAGRKVSFETCYVVPVDAKEIELEYSELISWNDEKIIIKLQ